MKLRSLVKYFSTLEEKFRISARPCNILYISNKTVRLSGSTRLFDNMQTFVSHNMATFQMVHKLGRSGRMLNFFRKAKLNKYDAKTAVCIISKNAIGCQSRLELWLPLVLYDHLEVGRRSTRTTFS